MFSGARGQVGEALEPVDAGLEDVARAAASTRAAAYRSTVFALTSLPPPCPTSTLDVTTLITCGSFVSENADSIWSLNARTNSCWRAVR